MPSLLPPTNHIVDSSEEGEDGGYRLLTRTTKDGPITVNGIIASPWPKLPPVSVAGGEWAISNTEGRFVSVYRVMDNGVEESKAFTANASASSQKVKEVVGDEIMPEVGGKQSESEEQVPVVKKKSGGCGCGCSGEGTGRTAGSEFEAEGVVVEY